jgi:adenylylsulfate kinase
MAFTETKTRSVLKAVSWRLFGSTATAFATYLLVGRWQVAVMVGGLEAASKFVLFFFHERLWNHVKIGKESLSPAVIWLTGFSGAGKSTIAKELARQLRAQGAKVEELDGDTIREIFPQIGFTRQDREQHVRRVGYLASRLESQGVFVVASLISPYSESRNFVRSLCQNFVEIHVATSIAECRRRDPKGLYKKVDKGEIKGFTGVDDPYETPPSPELRLETETRSVEECVQEILRVTTAKTANIKKQPKATQRDIPLKEYQ